MTPDPSPRLVAEDFLARLIAACSPGARIVWSPELHPLTIECRSMSDEAAAATAIALFAAAGDVIDAMTAAHGPPPWKEHPFEYAAHAAAVNDFASLILQRKNSALTPDHIRELLRHAARMDDARKAFSPHVHEIVRVVDERWSELRGCPVVRDRLEQIATVAARPEGLRRRDFQYSGGDTGALFVRIRRLLDPPNAFPIDPGEAWSDAALEQLRAWPPERRSLWADLLYLCYSNASASPRARWRRDATTLVKAIGVARVRACLLRWLPLVAKPRTDDWPYLDPDYNRHFRQTIWPHHADVLRGFCWLAALHPSDDLARTLGAVVLVSYRKLPGRGERCAKVGNAAVAALGEMGSPAALAQLAALRARVRFATGQRLIAKALTELAERRGVEPHEIEEIAVPTFGMCEVGRLDAELGGFNAALTLGRDRLADAELTWFSPAGARLRATPAAVKSDFAEELQGLKTMAKDLRQLLPAQRDRLDDLVRTPRSWPLALWRERYLDHPLVGVAARRLIWQFEDGAAPIAAAWLRHDPEGPPHGPGALVRADGARFEPPASARVSLWLPLDAAADWRPREDIAAWRSFYEGHQIRQPFKQAHRETYTLTDEERGAVYTNRFAGRLLRQRIYRGLAHERRWRDALRHPNETDAPPTHLTLPYWGIRVEFWVRGHGEELDGAGYKTIVTDQVRFYRMDAIRQGVPRKALLNAVHDPDAPTNQPLRLGQVPAIVISEALRDIDLMVSVADNGLEAEWRDAGEADQHRHYWLQGVVGSLGPAGEERRALLQRLLPRLRIAPACTITDRFLVVLGKKSPYRIHLGSGATLLPPDDRLLNIGPPRTRPSSREHDPVCLPFEGDNMLSVILSKAILLAHDDEITDPAILRQIESI